MDKAQFAETVARLILVYESYLKDLGEEMELGRVDTRGVSVAGTHTARRELLRLTDLAKQEGMDPTPYTTLAKIQGRIEDLTLERDRLLAELGTERTRQLLLAGLRTYTAAYASRISHMVEDWDQLTREDYEEDHLADQMKDLEVLTNRDMIDLLMTEFSTKQVPAELTEQLSAIDAVLRQEGKHLLGPLCGAGVVQRGRRALFEPRQRWWHYLGEPNE